MCHSDLREFLSVKAKEFLFSQPSLLCGSFGKACKLVPWDERAGEGSCHCHEELRFKLCYVREEDCTKEWIAWSVDDAQFFPMLLLAQGMPKLTGPSECLGVLTMERDRVAGSCNSPPYFDGNNYSAWREKFEIFLDALDEYASEYLTKDWVAPVKTVESKAWDKLRVVHEGDDQVRTLKLHMVLAQFEELRMSETEFISEFYGRVEMIKNKAMSLGQTIEEILVVHKIIHVLPSRFRAKKTAIMEVQNLNEIKLGKLVGKLKTYEMELNMEENDTKKSKNVALQGVYDSSLKGGEKSSGFKDEMALFVKKFRRILKDMGKFAREGSSSSERQFRPSTDRSNDRNKDVKLFTKDFRKSVKCFTCGGIGHYAADCANN
ncbi:unnamed protein product [Prunus armeniaca]